jgi:hypothetical protein
MEILLSKFSFFFFFFLLFYQQLLLIHLLVLQNKVALERLVIGLDQLKEKKGREREREITNETKLPTAKLILLLTSKVLS